MSAIYNPEAETIAQIEWLEREVRDVRRRVERVFNEEDRRVLTRQAAELKDQIVRLQSKLP